MGKSKPNNPLKHFNDLRDKRVTAVQQALKKFQGDVNSSTVENTPAIPPAPPTSDMFSEPKNASVTYAKQAGNLGVQFGVGADLNTSGGGKILSNPAFNVGVTKGGFNAGASLDPLTGKVSGELGWKKGPLNINLKTNKKGGSTKSKKKK